MGSKVLERDSDRADLSAVSAVEATCLEQPVVATARERDGSTVLRLADSSTITLVGVARFDQLTLFGDRLRAIRQVV